MLSMPKKELVRNSPIEQGSSRYLEEDISGSKLLCLCGKSMEEIKFIYESRILFPDLIRVLIIRNP